MIIGECTYVELCPQHWEDATKSSRLSNYYHILGFFRVKLVRLQH